MKFNGEEGERCPKTSPLTFTRVLKALVESVEKEKRERPIKKRKGAETEIGREVCHVWEQASTSISDQGDSSKEMGGFEAELEQPVFSPITNHGVPAQTRAKERREESDNEKSSSVEQLFTLKQRSKGKKRATTNDSNNSELLAMLEEMKEELKERDGKIREELRWIDNYLEDQIKKKENTLVATLK